MSELVPSALLDLISDQSMCSVLNLKCHFLIALGIVDHSLKRIGFDPFFECKALSALALRLCVIHF